MSRSAGPRNSACRAADCVHQKALRSHRKQARKSAQLRAGTASAHASSPPATHKASPEASNWLRRPPAHALEEVCPGSRSGSHATTRKRRQFFPVGLELRGGVVVFAWEVRICLASNGGDGSRAEGGSEAGYTRGAAGRGRGRGLTRVSAAVSRGPVGHGRQPLRGRE